MGPKQAINSIKEPRVDRQPPRFPSQTNYHQPAPIDTFGAIGALNQDIGVNCQRLFGYSAYIEYIGRNTWLHLHKIIGKNV